MRSMNEIFSRERAAEAYAHMMSGRQGFGWFLLRDLRASGENNGDRREPTSTNRILASENRTMVTNDATPGTDFSDNRETFL